jgi:hypothetical protein
VLLDADFKSFLHSFPDLAEQILLVKQEQDLETSCSLDKGPGLTGALRSSVEAAAMGSAAIGGAAVQRLGAGAAMGGAAIGGTASLAVGVAGGASSSARQLRESCKCRASALGGRASALGGWRARNDTPRGIERSTKALDKAHNAFIDVDALWQTLKRADILLLRSEYLVHLWRTNECIQRRQDLPAEAFHSSAALGGRAIVVISYSWISKDAPDPEAFHLSILAPLLERFTDAYGRAAVFLEHVMHAPNPPRSHPHTRAVRGTEPLRGADG